MDPIRPPERKSDRLLVQPRSRGPLHAKPNASDHRGIARRPACDSRRRDAGTGSVSSRAIE